MIPPFFLQPILPTTSRIPEKRQCPLPCHLEHVSAESWPQPGCSSKLENLTSRGKTTVSRRCFTSHTLAVLVSTTAARVVHAAPARTIIDEERELSERMRKKDVENRRKALRAAFEAVDKASQQLDEVPKFVKDDDWKRIRQFTRLFNNAVEREGMEPLTRQLGSKQQQQDSLNLCKQLTRTLQEMDQSAKREDGEAVLAKLQNTRQLVAAFQEFKP